MPVPCNQTTSSWPLHSLAKATAKLTFCLRPSPSRYRKSPLSALWRSPVPDHSSESERSKARKGKNNQEEALIIILSPPPPLPFVYLLSYSLSLSGGVAGSPRPPAIRHPTRPSSQLSTYLQRPASNPQAASTALAGYRSSAEIEHRSARPWLLSTALVLAAAALPLASHEPTSAAQPPRRRPLNTE